MATEKRKPTLEEVKFTIDRVASNQKFAVLSTIMDGCPYCNLVAFLADSDRDVIYFATPRFTRKYNNIKDVPFVSLFIDNRENTSGDFEDAVAINARGRAEELIGEDEEECRKKYLKKFPYLEEFVNAPSNVIFGVLVEKYDVVCRFKEVFQYKVRNRELDL